MIRSYTGFDYFGARYYANDLSIWLSVDPLADQYPSTSPFMYVLGNPIIFVDPNGMNHDWFKDGAGNYKWFDEPTGDFSDTESKKSWTHVGASDEDVLIDMGYPTNPVQKESAEFHQSYAGNDDKSSAGSTEIIKLTATFYFSASVTKSKEDITEQNKEGRVFEGVNVDVSFSHHDYQGYTAPGLDFVFSEKEFSNYKMYNSDRNGPIFGNPNTKYFDRSMTILKPNSLLSIKVSGSFWIDLGHVGKVPKAVPGTMGIIPNGYELKFKRK
jgi:RHS repeat-associated protein